MVALGLRMIGQEQELAEKRLHDEQLRVTGQVRQELSSRLERIALQEVAALAAEPDRVRASKYGSPEVALVARMVAGRIILPWEEDSRPDHSRRLMEDADIAHRVSRGEHEELVSGDAERALQHYRQALDVAHHPVQIAYVQLLLARALGRTGHDREALIYNQAVLTSPPDLVDEHGLPFSLYAAVQSVQQDTDHQTVLACLERQMEGPRWLNPPTLHLMRRLLATMSESGFGAAAAARAEDLERTISDYVNRTEQALALQHDFLNLGVATQTGSQARPANATWVAYGTPTWLVAAAPSAGTEQAVVVAVRAEGIFASLSEEVAASGEITGRVAVVTDGDQEGETLGPGFPGLEVVFPPGQSTAFDRQRDAQRRFYLVALALVVGTTLFSAYLLWRDVKREIRLAEMRSNFVSAVSHELKTPLAAIRMFADTLRMGRPSKQEAKTEYLETIVNESERLTRLLNNVLDFSKIERGRKTYRREPHCLAEILQSTVRAMKYPAEQHHFHIHVHLDEEVPPMPVDRDAIEQAILNLLANAMKYSAESRDIDLRLNSADGQAVIEVADRGIGIEPEECERIFQQFYRIHSPENQQIPGTGLGLTLVRHIVEGHGGVVTVDSARGEGSTFAIHLPLEAIEP
jgi:signal transduction histidine kinase